MTWCNHFRPECPIPSFVTLMAATSFLVCASEGLKAQLIAGSQRQCKAQSYSDLVHKQLGRAGDIFVQASIIINNAGKSHWPFTPMQECVLVNLVYQDLCHALKQAKPAGSNLWMGENHTNSEHIALPPNFLLLYSGTRKFIYEQTTIPV